MGLVDFRFKTILDELPTSDQDATQDIMLNFMSDEAQNCLKSSGIIFNTFDEVEHQVLKTINAKFPNTYTIGPLSLLERHISRTLAAKSLRSNLLKEDLKCIKWLDKQKPKSVVYVNYGSITILLEEQFK